MIIFLLGFGLVEIPKNLFRIANYKSRIKYLEWKGGNNKENLSLKKDEIKDYKKVKK